MEVGQFVEIEQVDREFFEKPCFGIAFGGGKHLVAFADPPDNKLAGMIAWVWAGSREIGDEPSRKGGK